MARLLHLDSSARTEGSHSREVAAAYRRTWQDAHPGGEVVHRDLALHPLPHLVTTVRAAGTPEQDRNGSERAAFALKQEVVAEAERADAFLISLPMYNWAIPSQLKAYLDHLLENGRTFTTDGSTPSLAGRPATVVVSFGGGYGPGTPRAGWDFVRPYLSTVLEQALGLQVEFVVVELTLAPYVPAMADLVPLARASREAALEQAGARARTVVERLAG